MAADPLDALLSEGADALPEDDERAEVDDLEAEPDGDEFSTLAEDVFDDTLDPAERIEALRSAIMALTGPKLEM